ncbi:MAG: sulfurtransferase TusA family protein [Rhodospirillaceae bacterium]|nr:sulfurtransferase TusA family protein [Rhodospirillaceae bacterium]
MNENAKYDLDITSDVCPITFVKTKLMLEKKPAGAVVKVRLKGIEPLDNVPRSVIAHGHDVMSLVPEDPGKSDHSFPHILTIKRT